MTMFYVIYDVTEPVPSEEGAPLSAMTRQEVFGPCATPDSAKVLFEALRAGNAAMSGAVICRAIEAIQNVDDGGAHD